MARIKIPGVASTFRTALTLSSKEMMYDYDKKLIYYGDGVTPGGISLATAGGGGGGSINFSAAGSSNNLDSIVWSNANGVTFGLTGSTMTASIGAGVGGSINFSAGTTSQNLTNIVWSNLNGISFGLNGSTITASHNAITTARRSTDGVGLATAGTNITWTVNSNGISINAAGYLSTARASNDGIGLNTAKTNVTWTVNSAGISLDAGAYLTTAQPVGAYLTTARSSNDAVGLNTAATNVTWTINSAGISLNAGGYAGTGTSATNASITLNSNGLQISVNAGGGGGSINFSAGTTSNNIAAVTFKNLNGVTFGLDAGTITASHNGLTTARASNDAIGLNSALTANGVSMTANSSGLSLNFPAFLTTAQPVGAYLTTARASNDAVGLNTALTANGVSWTVNSSGLSMNFPAFLTTADLSANSSKYIQNWKLTGNTAGTSSSAQGTDIWYSGGNGVTLSGNSNTIVFSVATNYQSQGAYLTTAALSQNTSNYAGINSAITNGLMTVNTSGISLNLSNHLTTARASTDAIGLNTAGTNMTWTANSSGLSIDARGYAGTGTTFGGTNISGSMTHNSAGLNLALSVAAPGGGGSINFSAGTTSGNVASVTFGDAGGVSFGYNNGTITAVAPAGAPSPMVWSAGGTSYNIGSVEFRDANGISFGLGAGALSTRITASYNSTQFAGIGTSATNASITLDSNGLAISVAAPSGGAGVTMSNFRPYELGNNTTFTSLGNSTLYLQKMRSPAAFAFSHIERYVSGSFASSTNNASVNYSIMYALYSRDAGTNSTRMTRMGSSQMEMRVAFSSNSSAAYSVVLNGASVNSSGSAGTGFYSNLTGGKHMYFPYATTLDGGQDYWVGFNVMSASTITSTPYRLAFLEMSAINNLTWGKIKTDSVYATNASYVGDWAQGVYTAATAGMPATVADLNLTNAISLMSQFLQFDNL